MLNLSAISTSVRDAPDFVELCRIWGYEAEEHIVQTKDGYLLGIHRLQWRRGEEGQKVNCGVGSTRKRVIYLHHGLLMNSEVWVCLTDERRCLPFELVERGFDVWVSLLHLNVTGVYRLTELAWKQPWKQVFEEVNPCLTDDGKILGLFHG